jgi:hypothetical protein
LWFDTEITVPASTTAASPQETVVSVSAGVITKVSYRPRDGHLWLCHCLVFYHNTQIFPLNLEGDLHGDYFPIEWQEFIELSREPYELKILSWNEDTDNDHTYDISFAILPRAAVTALAIIEAITSLVRALSPRRLFGGG